ncbi:MAG: hypothetical protein M0Z45_10345 [Actinomycetota bacterium]|nr:hypothetical protein [Actinomycetota bacterium]
MRGVHFRPKLTILVAAAISYTSYTSYTQGNITLDDLLTRIMIALAISFIGITLISYLLAIFAAQSIASVELLRAQNTQEQTLPQLGEGTPGELPNGN